MKSRRARIGGFLLVLATMSCAGVGRSQPGVGVPTAGYPQVQSDSLPAPEVPGTGLAEPAAYDPALDLLDPSSFVGSRRQSFVIIDPANPQNLRGFVRLGVWLSDLMSKYTGLHVDATGGVDLMDCPIISFAGASSHAAIQSMVTYLTHGGFALGGVAPELEHALQEYGIDFYWERLTADHPIYHCYFDLAPGPSDKYGPSGPGDFGMAGLYIGDRLVSVRDIPADERWIVNAVVFALIQPGGIAKRYMRK